MKKILTLALFFILLSVCSIAQDGDSPERNGSRIEALKIAFLTRKLNLSPDEAQRFWPVYNNYSEEMRAARVDQRRNKISELESEENMLSIRKKYNAEFSKALGPARVDTFFKSEKEFGNFVRKELAERRQLRQSLNNGQRPAR